MWLWFLIFLCGFIFSKGSFSYPSIYILIISILIFPFFIFSKKLNKQTSINPWILLILVIILSILVYGGFYQVKYVFISNLLLGFSLIFAFLIWLLQSKKIKTFIFALLIFLAFTLRILMVLGSPNPHIDVFDFIKLGGSGLIKGINPYSNTYTPMYDGVTPNYYTYLPTTILLTLPSVAIFNDPRYAMVFTDLIVAFLIFKIFKKGDEKYAFPLIFLYNPISLVVLEESFTEPLVLLLIVLSAFFIKDKRHFLGAIFFGLMLATKQYLILILPLIIRPYPKISQKLTFLFASVLTALIIILPFFFWNPKDFWYDTVTSVIESPNRPWSLSFTSFLYQFGINLSPLFSWLGVAVLLILLHLKKINIHKFFYFSAFLLFIFFFFNRWSAINYYYLISQFLLLGMAFELCTKRF